LYNLVYSKRRIKMEEIEEKTQNDDILAEESVMLEEYKKLKENSVSKEQYEKDINLLKEKNSLYLKAITEGERVELPQENSGSLEDAINSISKFRGTNLEYWQEMTPLIDRVIKEIPEAEITKIAGGEGLEEIIKVNEAMKKMVSDSKGDPDMFRTLYKQRVTDSAPKISSDIEKNGGLINYLYNQSIKK
jgi:hypothetical protein